MSMKVGKILQKKPGIFATLRAAEKLLSSDQYYDIWLGASGVWNGSPMKMGLHQGVNLGDVKTFSLLQRVE